MNYREIENFKSTLLQIIKQGCRIRIDASGIDGKILGIGFRPYWTNPADSKIDKVEFNILNDYGKIVPFYLNNVIGCEIKAQDGASLDRSKNLSLVIFAFSPDKSGSNEPYDKATIQIYK